MTITKNTGAIVITLPSRTSSSLAEQLMQGVNVAVRLALTNPNVRSGDYDALVPLLDLQAKMLPQEGNIEQLA